MKRLDFDSNNAHIVKISAPKSDQLDNIENGKSGFDLIKLLQILPKLNLSELFGSQNAGAKVAPTPQNQLPHIKDTVFSNEFLQTRDFCAQQNLELAKSSLEKHIKLVNNLRK